MLPSPHGETLRVDRTVPKHCTVKRALEIAKLAFYSPEMPSQMTS